MRDGHWKDAKRKKASPEFLQSLMKQKGSTYDSFLRDDVNKFVPKDGPNTIRFLPSDPESQHYGKEIYVHYGVGPDNCQYLCLRAMRRGQCPICEEQYSNQAAEDEDYARSCKPKKRVLAYLIDRDAEHDGVKVWAQPFTFDRELAGLREDRETREWLQIDHETEGYDISFRRESSGGFPKYTGLTIFRHSSPVSRDPKKMDEWLQKAFRDEWDDILIYHDYEHIKNVFHGGIAREEDDEEETESAIPQETFRRPQADDFPDEGQREPASPPNQPPARETFESEESADDLTAAKENIKEKWMRR